MSSAADTGRAAARAVRSVGLELEGEALNSESMILYLLDS